MTITELIDKLEHLREKHGNLSIEIMPCHFEQGDTFAKEVYLSNDWSGNKTATISADYN